jgi:peptidoglycan/xylan/chitin deacetylase (PgdA/CDA1 family)
MNANDVVGNWIDDFVFLKKNLDWGVITYTFHPFVSGRGHRLLALEKLIRTLKDKGAVFMQLGKAATEYDKRQPFTGA